MVFRIYRYELRKIMLRKHMIVAFLAALAIVIGAFIQYMQWDGKLVGSYENYQKWAGPYTAAKDKQIQNLVMNETDETTDPTLYQALQVTGYAMNYQMDLTQLKKSLKADKPGTYAYRRDRYEIAQLQQNGVPSFEYTGMWEYILRFMEYQGYLIVGALLLLGVPSIFAGEFTSHVFSMLRSTRQGTRKIFAAKLLAVLTYATLVGGGMVILNIIPNLLRYGGHGWDVALHNLRGYDTTVMHMSVGQSVLLQFGLCTFSCIAFVILVSLLSLVTKSSVMTLLLGCLAFFVPSYAFATFNSHMINTICKFSYAQMMQLAPIIRQVDALNWFGTPIQPLGVIVITHLVLCALFVALMYRRFMRSEALG